MLYKQPSMFYWKAAALKIQYLGTNHFSFQYISVKVYIFNKIFSCRKSSSLRPAAFLKLERIFYLLQEFLQNFQKKSFSELFWQKSSF